MNAETSEEVKLVNDLPVKEKEYKLEIAALKEKHAGLSLTDVGDKKTYELIKKARIDFKTMRVGVEKYCKALRDQATAFSKSVIAKEKEIIALIEADENRLALEEKKYTDEQERIVREDTRIE